MSNYFGTGLDQAPLNEQLGEAAYWDLKQLYDLLTGIPKIVDSSYTAKPWETVGIDTTDGIVTVTLPAGPEVNDRIRFFDAGASWDDENAVIARNGSSIMGIDEDMALNIRGGNFTLVFVGGNQGWVIV